MKKRSSVFGYVILWILLAGTVLIISGMNKKEEPATASAAPGPTPARVTAVRPPQEDADMLGLWVPYMSLETKEGTQKAFEQNFKEIVAQAKEIKVNNLFVHVRAFSDALYQSDYYPWSHLVTGTQGKDPGFDPLQFMIEEAHENGMKLHAWINPLRVRTTATPEVLSEDNPYSQLSESNPYYFMNVDGAIYLNPAYQEMRGLICDGAVEIAKKYDVDGIHFDDYFYPENVGDGDSEAYESYCENTDNPLSIEDWRTANINTMVSGVYRELKAVKPELPFGISPQGNIGNNKGLGADVYAWCSTKGYIDYIMPQIYFSYDNPALGFTDCLEDWLEIDKHEDLKMYIGLGLYKAGTDSDGGTWENSSDTIARQIEDVGKTDCDGVVLFDSGSLTAEAASAEVASIKDIE